MRCECCGLRTPRPRCEACATPEPLEYLDELDAADGDAEADGDADAGADADDQRLRDRYGMDDDDRDDPED